MFLTIDPHNGVAIYEQIVRQIKFAVASQAVRPAELVPSVRELARQLAINPNTVSRAYRELQSDGVLETVRGMGLAVTNAAPRRCRDDRKRILRQRIRQVLAEAKQSQIDGDELRAMVDDEMKRMEEKRRSGPA
jgi:GntR family transcriptional regulator